MDWFVFRVGCLNWAEKRQTEVKRSDRWIAAENVDDFLHEDLRNSAIVKYNVTFRKEKNGEETMRWLGAIRWSQEMGFTPERTVRVDGKPVGSIQSFVY